MVCSFAEPSTAQQRPALQSMLGKLAAKWGKVWHILSQYSGAAIRLHLALFYFYGLYYHWSKRATGKHVQHIKCCSCRSCCSAAMAFTACACQCSVTALVTCMQHAGVRYIFIGKIFEHRPSYHLLGVLLFIQLGITGAFWTVEQTRHLMSDNSNPTGADQQQASQTALRQQTKAVVLEVCEQGCMHCML